MTRALLPLLPLCAMLTLPSAAAAAPCLARVNHQEIVVDPAEFEAGGKVGLRERMMSWPTRSWNRAWGSPPTCDSETLIAFLGASAPQEDLAGYCLADDPEGGGDLLVPGPRNYRGRCTRTTCDVVNATADGAGAIAGRATDIVTGRDTEGGQSRTEAVMHASGAAILSGTAGSLAGTLSGVAGGLATALSAPAVAGAAAVSVVAVGGAVYLCRDGDAAGTDAGTAPEGEHVPAAEGPETEAAPPAE